MTQQFRIKNFCTIAAKAFVHFVSRTKSGEPRSSIFADVDVLVTPTVPNPPHRIGDMAPGGPFKNMNPFNTYGLPAISVPCGFTSDGLPIGLQLIGPHWAEGAVFQLAHAYERATPWHERHPML